MADQFEKVLNDVRALGLQGQALAALRTMVREQRALNEAKVGSGHRARKLSSAKKKGRQGVVEARNWLLGWYSLEPDDILIQTTSVGGSDLHFSPVAKRTFPFAPEVKFVESLNIWGAIHQAVANAKKRLMAPCLFFRRANHDMWVAFPCSELHLLQRALRVPDPVDGEERTGSGDHSAGKEIP